MQQNNDCAAKVWKAFNTIWSKLIYDDNEYDKKNDPGC